METRSDLRNVLGLAHEVRVYLRDEGIVVATVLPGAGPRSLAFRLLPWGTTSVRTIPVEQILRAAPVRRMSWREQRRICAAQGAGVFERRPSSAGTRARESERREPATALVDSDGLPVSWL